MSEDYFEQYQNILKDNVSKTQREFIIPSRRQPCNSGLDTDWKVERAKHDKFIDDVDIIEVHAMRFRRNSPFVKPLSQMTIDLLSSHETINTRSGTISRDSLWKEIIDENISQNLHAIAITKDNRHVVLQRGASVPFAACVLMILLDRKCGITNQIINSLEHANIEMSKTWLRDAGFLVETTQLKKDSDNLKILSDAVNKSGSLILILSHPHLHQHTIILDSINKDQCIIRDSFHGWSITIKTSLLLSYIGDYNEMTQIYDTNTIKHTD